MASGAELASETAGPRLLDLPPNCLERVLELVLFCYDDGARQWPPFPASSRSGFSLPAGITADPLLACKALWQAAQAMLPHRLSVNLPGGGQGPDRRFEQLLQTCPGLQQLALAASERRPDSTSLAALTQLSSLELHCRTVEAGPGGPGLSRLAALRTLRLDVSDVVQLQPGVPLPRLNPDLQELFVTGPDLPNAWSFPTCLLAGSASLLGMSRMRRMALARFRLEDPPEAPQSPAIQSLTLAQCSSHWWEPAVLSRLASLTALVLQCNRPPRVNLLPEHLTFLDLSSAPQLRKLCIAMELFTELPLGVPQMSGLTALDLSYNLLGSLPAGPYLSSLRQLSLAHTRFASLPPVLEAATALEALDITGCSRLRLREMSVLTRMPALLTVHLRHKAPSTHLPTLRLERESKQQELSQLKDEMELAAELQAMLRRRRPCATSWLEPPLLPRMSGLTELVLQRSMDDEVNFSTLAHLRRLCLAAELLTELPAGLAQLSCLTALDLSCNKLTDLPAGPYLSSLRQLSLAHNRFVRLPPVLVAATALEALDLTGCDKLSTGLGVLTRVRAQLA
ncbi:leucine rich repeat [Chlorella sorokiniana]|uniref:Leucine rich repeat n=1 Tax=Chlorella sorokiniana TaxID=3076 RepID=A0A2P6TGC8_CHLSO|nr:leucine rich repeat [Chlorella sorokiniana]|eukprot:PRW33166.1 leucine rich repeat [Chlorella sorokiniana]